MRALLALLLIVSLLLAPAVPAHAATQKGLTIVATFPGLAEDLKLLACPGDRVVSLLPAGVDPHEYTLTPGDVEVLKSADLVVSTGHTSFELKIESLAASGELRGVVVNILRIPGVRVYDNPATGTPDYHMPIYDPLNYVAFVKYVSWVMAALNMAESSCYAERASSLISRVVELYTRAPYLDAKAIADFPYAVYAVSWLGVEVVGLLVKEEGVAPSPQELAEYEAMVSQRRVGLLVVTAVGSDNPAASSKLLEWSNKYKIPVLKLQSATYNGSVVSKLEFIVGQIAQIQPSPWPSSTSGEAQAPGGGAQWLYALGVGAAALAIAAAAAGVAKWRRSR